MLYNNWWALRVSYLNQMITGCGGWHQPQPVIVWFKYETLSARQLLYSIADTECITYEWASTTAILTISIYIFFLNTKHIMVYLTSNSKTWRGMLHIRTSVQQTLNFFYLMHITAILVFSVKTLNMHLHEFKALALYSIALLTIANVMSMLFSIGIYKSTQLSTVWCVTVDTCHSNC